MSSGKQRNQCEDYARDCVRLAQNPSATPELRDPLLAMARDWMRMAMDELGESGTDNPSASG